MVNCWCNCKLLWLSVAITRLYKVSYLNSISFNHMHFSSGYFCVMYQKLNPMWSYSILNPLIWLALGWSNSFNLLSVLLHAWGYSSDEEIRAGVLNPFHAHCFPDPKLTNIHITVDFSIHKIWGKEIITHAFENLSEDQREILLKRGLVTEQQWSEFQFILSSIN